MRLTKDEIAAFVHSINVHVVLHQSELKLYGSRTKDELKGGDIDVLLIVPDAQLYEQLLMKKVDILVEVKAKIGDQKIDLTLAVKQEIDRDPFLKMIHKEAVLLHWWN